MKKDCSSCPQWSPADESCTAAELLEYEPEAFYEVCPKENGDPEYQDS